MPLPLGHVAVGAAVYFVCSDPSTDFIKNNWLALSGFIFVLSNLPDIDFIFGLVYAGDGSIMHRGPTHTIYFALLFGWLTYWLSKYSTVIPDVGFFSCFLVILSHSILDIITDMWEMKSFSWEYFLKLFYFSSIKPPNNLGFFDIVNMVYKKSLGDYKIIIFGILVAVIFFLLKK